MKFIVFLTCIHVALSVDPVVTIKDTSPAAVTTPTGRVMAVKKNNDAMLTCVVENKQPENEVEWIAIPPTPNVPPVLISIGPADKDPIRYQVDKPQALAWRLKVKKCQLYNEMKYVCRVKIGEQKYAKDEMNITVLILPVINDLETSSDMTVSKGDPVSLRCNATGKPFPIITWERLAGGQLSSGGRMHKDYILDLGLADPKQRGMYKCTAENKYGSAQRIVTLTIRFAPDAQAEENPVRQAVGYRKSLRCFFEAYPIPTESQVMWTKNGNPLSASDNYEVTYIEGSSDKVTSKLTIKRVTSEDFGYYQCQASNSEGSGSTQIELQSSPYPTKDSTGRISSAGILSFSMTTILMLLFICLLHYL